MQMKRRRQRNPDDEGSNVQISFKIPSGLLEKIDLAWPMYGKYTGRGHYIEEACRYYLTLEECPECGTLHDEYATHCHVCGQKLHLFDDLTQNLKSLYDEAQRYMVMMRETINKFKIFCGNIAYRLEKCDLNSQKEIEKIVDPLFSETDETMNLFDTILNNISDFKMTDDMWYKVKNPERHFFGVFFPVKDSLDKYDEKHMYERFAFETGYLLSLIKDMIDSEFELYHTSMLFNTYSDFKMYVRTLKNYTDTCTIALQRMSSIEAMIDFIVENSKK